MILTIILPRFIVLGGKQITLPGKIGHRLRSEVKNQFGALYDVLTSFYNSGISLSKIESRPSGQDLWEHVSM